MNTDPVLMENAMPAVQVWSCPCGAHAVESQGGLQCETCGRTFDDRGRRVVTEEDDADVLAQPDWDVLHGGAVN